MKEDQGKRFNSGKTRHDLLPAFAIEQMAKVFTMGAGKYGDRNWEKSMKWSKIISSLKRHILAIESGKDYDHESGFLHAAHVMCNAAFLTEYYKIHPQGDDREIFSMKNWRIGLDIDDVLSDFCTPFCERYKLPIPKFWNFDRTIASKFEELKTDKDFWVNLPVKTHPDSIPFEPVCYITSRNIPKEWTEEWLDKNGFAAVPVHVVGLEGSKIECAQKENLDFFIDDKYANFVELTNAGIFTFLFDNPHNARYDVGHRRIKSIKEIEGYKYES